MTPLLRPAVAMTALFTAVLGLAYPLALTGAARLAPDLAGGSLIRTPGGAVVGSRLIGQAFARPDYLHPRPSAAGSGYDATASGGSNLGPLDSHLADRVRSDAARLRAEVGLAVPLPADALTTSGSGLDPDISPENARLQAPRIAQARGVPPAEVLAVIDAHAQDRWLGVFGEPRVNVLETNLALDADPRTSHHGSR